ncbi:hypothetical protein Tco_0722677 [Tanacetum coccineum]
MLHSIHNDDGNPTSANIKQALPQCLTCVMVKPNYQRTIGFVGTTRDTAMKWELNLYTHERLSLWEKTSEIVHEGVVKRHGIPVSIICDLDLDMLRVVVIDFDMVGLNICLENVVRLFVWAKVGRSSNLTVQRFGKPMEFEVVIKWGMLKVFNLEKGVVQFWQNEGNYNPGFVGTFKKCYAEKLLAVPLDGLHIDDKLQFVEEPIEITDREVKRLKRSPPPPCSVSH